MTPQSSPARDIPERLARLRSRLAGTPELVAEVEAIEARVWELELHSRQVDYDVEKLKEALSLVIEIVAHSNPRPDEWLATWFGNLRETERKLNGTSRVQS